MPRVGLSPTGVVDAAVALLDEEGVAALTLARVAARTRVATPSLYKHVRNLAELRKLIALRVLDEMTERLGGAIMGRSGDEAVRAMMIAYRGYVTEYPHRYAALPLEPLSDPDLGATASRQLEVVLAVLHGFGLTGSAAIHAARCLRATAHGFASLEAAGGFGLPEKLDTSFEHLVRMLILGIRAME